jgi:predicted aspartyl protease
MKVFLLALLFLTAGCTKLTTPRLSPFRDAPESVRDRVRFDFSNSEHPVEHYSMRRHVPPTDWIDLGAVFDDDGGVYVEGIFSYDDSGAFERIQRMRIDTGSNGFLGISLANNLSSKVWISDEYGTRTSHAFRGMYRSWLGVGTWLSISGVSYAPVPLSITDTTEQSLVETPLLGQDWFELAEAAWINPRDRLLAVSFDRHAVDTFLTGKEWISLPWRATNPGGHRFIPVEIDGVAFEAIIDTGMDRELFLDTPHPPSFVSKPWRRAQVGTPAGMVGPVWGATSNKPLQLNAYEISDLTVMWLGRRSTTLPQTPNDRPLALLGLDFLRRYPVVLDPKNNSAHFFIGDRASLSMPCTTP